MRTWTTAQLEVLRDLYPTHTNQHIAELVNKTAAAVKTRARILGLKKTIKNYGGDKRWTTEEDQKLKSLYPTIKVKDLVPILNRSAYSIKNRVNVLGIQLDHISFERSGRFPKGNIPVNKGQKMSPELYAKAAPTMFKKGNRPHNHQPVGTIRINGDGYFDQKIAEPRTWKGLHRIIWEQLNGPIPPGYNVQFKDKNRLNCDPENLYLIDRHNQMKQNTIHNYPPEVKELIRLSGKLKRKIEEYGTQQNG